MAAGSGIWGWGHPAISTAILKEEREEKI